MGLDVVEFVMAIEDAFGISIPDEEAQELTTPGELVGYLERRVPRATEARCPEQQAFHVLRRAALLTLGHPRKAFTPRTRWDALFPEGKRRSRWRLLELVAGREGWPRLTLRGMLPKEVSTIGATARWMTTHTPWPKRRGASWSRPEIQTLVRRLMYEQMRITEFRWDQRFAQDLGFV